MSAYLVLKSFDGSIGGCHLRRFRAGETVAIEDLDLAAVALAEGWVAPVDDLSGAPDLEKAVVAAPKNKARKAAPRVKTPTSSRGEAAPLEGGTRSGVKEDA